MPSRNHSRSPVRVGLPAHETGAPKLQRSDSASDTDASTDSEQGPSSRATKSAFGSGRKAQRPRAVLKPRGMQRDVPSAHVLKVEGRLPRDGHCPRGVRGEFHASGKPVLQEKARSEKFRDITAAALQEEREMELGAADAKSEIASDAEAVHEEKEEGDHKEERKILNEQSVPGWSTYVDTVIPVINRDVVNTRGFSKIAALAGLILWACGRKKLAAASATVGFGCSPIFGRLCNYVAGRFLSWTAPVAAPAVLSQTDVFDRIRMILAHPVQYPTLAGNRSWESFVLRKLFVWLGYFAHATGATDYHVNGWFRPCGHHQEVPCSHDVRAPSHRAAKVHADQVTHVFVEYVDAWKDKVVPLLTTWEMVNETAKKLQTAPVADCRRMSQQICSRISNLMITSSLSRHAVSGSADVAIAMCMHEKMRSEVIHDGVEDEPVRTEKESELFLRSSGQMLGAGAAALGLFAFRWLISSRRTPGLGEVPYYATSWKWSALPTLGLIITPEIKAINTGLGALIACVIGPFQEEITKSLMGWIGIPRPSTVFGVWEFGTKVLSLGFKPSMLLPLAMHIAIEGRAFAERFMCHSLYNTAMMYHYYYTVILEAVLKQLPEEFKALPPVDRALKAARLLLTTLWDNAVEEARKQQLPVPKGAGFVGMQWLRHLWSRLAAVLFRHTRARGGVIAHPTLVYYGFGYRKHDGIPFPATKPSRASVTRYPGYDEIKPRVPMQVSLGPILKMVAPPMVDRNDPRTALAGCKSRFCSVPPPVSRSDLRALREFVEKKVEEMFDPIPPTDDLSIPTWLDATPYSETRKLELLRAWDEADGARRFFTPWNESLAGGVVGGRFQHDAGLVLKQEDIQVKGHIKDETYMAYKHARGINSRSDVFKVLTGPYFKKMESIVYEHPAFIKHVPVRTRPEYIVNMLGSHPGPYYETDYTAFERHFTPAVLDSLEMVLYKHLLRNHMWMYEIIHAAMTGDNVCIYKNFVITIPGRRMSGEMCTSLGNGFSNLLLAMYVASLQGMEIIGVVEGDDGLFATKAKLSEDLFQRMGFTIKILEHSSILRSSFCGLQMSDDMITMTCPRKVLANFGWTHSPLKWGGHKVRMGLLRAKALSLMYEHPRCPILFALSRRFVDLTAGYKARYDDSWYDKTLNEEVATYAAQTVLMNDLGPSFQCRLDFADLYGIPVDLQIAIESEVSTYDTGVIDSMLIRSLYQDVRFNDLWDYWERYVSVFSTTF